MKKARLLTTAAAGAALLVLNSQALLAKNGADDSPASSPVAATPAATGTGVEDVSGRNSGSGSGSTGVESPSASPAAGHVEIEVERIQSVDLKRSNDVAGSKLSDDSSQKAVVLMRKNGKSLAVTKLDGKTETEKELSGSDSVNIQSVDARGKKHVVKIKTEGDHFRVIDGATSTTTKFPLMVDQKNSTFSVVTKDGTVAVKVTPEKAADALVSDDLLDQVDSSELELEDGTSEAPEKVEDIPKVAPASTSVVLRAKGVKHVNFLGFFPVDAHETASVNVKTGSEKSESKPWFLDVFGFLFSDK